MAVTKEAILQAIDELPPDKWEDLWLLIEFLKFKASATEVGATEPFIDPEGAFPELDLSYEAIETYLDETWQKRQNRLLVEE